MRKDTECQEFVKRVIMSHLFKIIMISTVSLNAFFMVLWTDYKTRYKLFRLFEVSRQNGSIFFCFPCFISENVIRFSGHHLFSITIHLYLDSSPPSLAALPSPGAPVLQTLITAVGQTVYTVASVIILLFVLMYIFAILGFYLFGVPDGGDMNNWGNLAVAFFTLFSLATVDGWTDLQHQLDARNFTLSRTFTIVFILLASFIFLSMFVGVMIIHTEDSIKKFERELMVERHMTLMEEKQVILKRQQEEVSRLMQRRKNVDYKSFSELVENFKKTLRHTDPMVLDDFGTSLPFIDVYLTTLDNQDTTICKLQELYYEIVHVLNLMLEDLPQKKQSHSSENVDEK
uniref:Cation channel sperm associated 3 n=1 Tax=Equus asinus TaxID=9793 RepID=A0A8C4PU21_EQUAS